MVEPEPDYPHHLQHYRASEIARLRTALRCSLFHITSSSGLAGILKAGLILANDGSRPYTYPQSENSFALLRHVVSLFDFESALDWQMVEQWWKCENFFTKHHPATFVLELLRDRMPAPLITYEQATTEVGYGPYKIPFVEAWSPFSIPVSAVRRVVVVRRCPVRFRSLCVSDKRLLQPHTLVRQLWPALRPPPDDRRVWE